MGSATVFPDRIISGRLPSASSAFTSELTAILIAIPQMFWFPEEYAIYSDSRSVLCSISNPFCHHPLVIDIYRWLRPLRDRAMTVHFCWVPGYVGIPGDEKADLEAVDAASTHTTLLLLAFLPGIIIPISQQRSDTRGSHHGRTLEQTNWEQSKNLFLHPPVVRIVSMKTFCQVYALDKHGWRTNICEVMSLLFVMNW